MNFSVDQRPLQQGENVSRMGIEDPEAERVRQAALRVIKDLQEEAEEESLKPRSGGLVRRRF